MQGPFSYSCHSYQYTTAAAAFGIPCAILVVPGARYVIRGIHCHVASSLGVCDRLYTMPAASLWAAIIYVRRVLTADAMPCLTPPSSLIPPPSLPPLLLLTAAAATFIDTGMSSLVFCFVYHDGDDGDDGGNDGDDVDADADDDGFLFQKQRVSLVSWCITYTSHQPRSKQLKAKPELGFLFHNGGVAATAAVRSCRC